MAIHKDSYNRLLEQLQPSGAVLVAVSKTKSVNDILELYQMGQRDFGENYVQELLEKQKQLPENINWHFIGHLQSNKVKNIAPFIHLIHGVDSFKLIQEIDKQGAKNNRTIHCLLQVHIAEEETKFGLDEAELAEVMQQLSSRPLPNVAVRGLMGMASFTDNPATLSNEFRTLKRLFEKCSHSIPTQDHPFNILSMGMSSDYHIALEEGSTMVRIGSLLFGERQ